MEVRQGVVTLAGEDSIAGSTLTIDRAVRNAVSFLGITVEQAVALASANPARLLRVDDHKGVISVGMDADLVILDQELRACGTLVGGEWASGPAVV